MGEKWERGGATLTAHVQHWSVAARVSLSTLNKTKQAHILQFAFAKIPLLNTSQ